MTMKRLLRIVACALAVFAHGVGTTTTLEQAKDAPQVSITYPTANLTLDQSRTSAIYLQAAVTDPDEPILSVRFFVCAASAAGCTGTANVAGTVASSPYQVQWSLPRVLSDQATSTQYVVWAEAQNLLGQTRLSSSVQFTVAQSAPSPSVTLVAPTGPGSEVGFVSPAAPVLFATATPGNSNPPSTIVRVDFLDGASVIGSLTAPNSSTNGYAWTWSNPAPGSHSITARAIDSLGDFGTSAPVTLYVLNANQPPKVTLTSPTTGQSFSSRDTVPLAATVTSGTGKVQRVEFIIGTTVIATAVSAPYSGSWANPPAGNYTIVARAIDDIGASTASPAAYIQVLSAPRAPGVVLTSPAPGTLQSSAAPLVLTANALAPDGNVARVDFYSGATLIGTSSVAPYRYSWTAPTPGNLSLSAKATDVLGVSGTSTPVTVNVIASQPPSVTLAVSPSASSYAAPAALKLLATPLAPSGTVAKVEFLASGVSLGTRTSAPFELAWSNVTPGSYSVIARVTDTLSNTASSTATVVRVVTNAAPTVQLTAPVAGQQLYTGQPVGLSATAADADGTISKVEFLVDGAMVATSLTAPFNGVWSAQGAGSHTIAVRATDNLGTAATSSPINVLVGANASPGVTLAQPSAGQAFSVGQPITLTATASDADGSISKVDFLFDGVAVATASTAPFTQSWAGATAGTHLVTARAMDNRGAMTVSAPVSVTVTTATVPVVSVTSPTANRNFATGSAVPLSATATVVGGTISQVDFYSGPILLGSSTASPYAIAWTPAAAGTYAITAKAVDNRGTTNTSSAVTINVVTPTVTIASPAPNASIAADFVTVIGTHQGPANAGVTVNGAIAKSDGQGNYFLDIPLTAGTNTIKVELATPDGQTLAQTQTVTSTGAAPMQIYAEPEIAFAPAGFTIRLQNRSGTPYKTVAFQNLVGGQLDSSAMDQTTLGKLTYAAPGLYKPTIVIADVLGRTYTQTLALLVTDKVATDAMLKATWSDFAAALARGDKNAALAAMSGPARVKYGPVLDALAPYMPEITLSWSAPITGALGANIAEFMVRRKIDTANQLFFVYFVRDGSGIWRLGSM